MSAIDHIYLKGVAAACHDVGICKIANVDAVATLAQYSLSRKMTKTAEGEPTPEEMQQVAQSGLTEGDIQGAAKVVQLVAEMKQKADLAAQSQAQNAQGQMPPGGGGMPPQGDPSMMGAPGGQGGGMVPGVAQPPMPPAPQPPQGPMGGGMGGM